MCLINSYLSRLPSSPRIQIVKNRAISMAALYLLFLLGFDKTTFNLNINLCKTFAALIHFSGLAIFFWTLLEGMQLMKTLSSNSLTDTNSSKYSTLVRYLVGYGTPLIFTFLAVFVSHVINNDGDSYIQTNYCWLQEKSFIYFYIGPATAVIAFNLVVFVKALMATNRSRVKRNISGFKNLLSQLKTWALLSFLLGITWATGLLIQDNMEEWSYVFVILNASQGITLFIHTVLMNDMVMLELKIRLGLVDQVELAIDKSRSRITASKSFKTGEKPRVRRRPGAREKQSSTSSDETGPPPPPRPVRKARDKQKVEGLYRKRDERMTTVYHIGMGNDYVSTPENTSLSSTNSSIHPSSYEQSSSESLFRRRDSRLEQRAKAVRVRAMPRVEETIQHDRLVRLKRHHSNKW